VRRDILARLRINALPFSTVTAWEEDERPLVTVTGLAVFVQKAAFHLAPKEGWRYHGAPAHESN
jgi:hypothetical protein